MTESQGLLTLCNVTTGKLDSNAAIEGGVYPFFTCAPQTLSINTYAFDTEAVLLAGNNASGVFPVKYYNGKFNAYQRTYVLESKNIEVLENRFLFYALQLQLNLLQNLSTGAATKFLTLGIMKEIQIPTVAILNQRKIVEIVSAYDDLIAANQRRIQLLEESARLLYREWFVKLRFPGHETVAVVDGVPEGWEKKTLGDVCDAIGGGTPSTAHSEYWNGDITWITPTDVTRNDCLILLDSEKKITEMGLRCSSAKLVPPETILMTSRASIGFFALINKPVCTNQGFISIVPYQEESRMFLLAHLQERVEEIKSIATGSTFKEITKKSFRNLSILWPTETTLQQFNNLVYPNIHQVRNIKTQNELLKQARDLLLPRLMSGALDVSRITLPKEVAP